MTRAQLEAILVERAGPLMAKATMSVATDGTNAALVDPIRSALNLMGFPVADPTTIADTDLVAITAEALDEFLARTELRILRTILRRLKTTNISIQGISVGTLWQQVLAAIQDLEAEINATWGRPAGAGASGACIVNLDLGISEVFP